MSALKSFVSINFCRKYYLILAVAWISACSSYQPPVQEPQNRYYIVKQNDNFHAIAFKFELSTEQLKRANKWLDPAKLTTGMRLVIPQPDSGLIQSIGSGKFIWPVKNIDVSSRFGYRNGNLHAGIDLRAPRGTSIYAPAAGRVTFSGRKRGYGRMLIIDHGNGIETAYAHNVKNIVAVGQNVLQGQLIARVGNSGNATGFHVHFETRREGKAVDPVTVVKAGLSEQ